MTVRLRPASPDDAEPAGAICYEAFKTIAERHGFPPDVTSASDTTHLISVLLSRPDIYSIIAEIDGRVVGSNFLWEADPVAGVGPITVDPGVQNRAIGRGHDGANALRDAIGEGTATVVEHAGRLTGYATGIGFFGHAVGETTEDLKALIAAASSFSGPGFLLPMRNADLFRWCLEQGLRVVQPMTLMSVGPYQEPQGAFLPSILY